MITYVIPTLWKDSNIFKTFKSFSDIEDSDARMIVINNTNQVRGYTDYRIEFINLGYNSFVNPAWNLGVHKSQTEYVCLLNDDRIYDLKTLHNYIKQYRPEFVGFCELNRNPTKDSIQLVRHEDRNVRPHGFGQFMLFKKNNWIKIPDDMKIFHGDDIIFFHHTLVLGIELHKLDGYPIRGNQSVSAQDWWENEIAKEDRIGYFKWISQNNMETSIHNIHKATWKKEDYNYKINNSTELCEGCDECMARLIRY